MSADAELGGDRGAFEGEDVFECGGFELGIGHALEVEQIAAVFREGGSTCFGVD